MAKGKIIFRRFGGRTIPIFVKGTTSFNLGQHTGKAVINIRALRYAKKTKRPVSEFLDKIPAKHEGRRWSVQMFKKHAKIRAKVAGANIARQLKKLERK